MKTKAIFVLAAILVLALAFSAAVPAAPGGKASPVPAPQPAAADPASPERHPEIHEAIAALRRAKGYMEHAAHDFDGHRVEALRATDQAIQQLEICLKYDKD